MRAYSNRSRPHRRPPTPVAESTAVLDRPTRTAAALDVRERSATSEAPRVLTGGRMAIRLIRAGWSLNGRYYPAEVLKRDGPKAFPAGTLAFVDHAGESEEQEYPAGTLTKLAAVMTGPAVWDEAQQALVGEVRVYAPWREMLAEMADAIGMSIRAWVYAEEGQAEGRFGTIVTGMPEGRSVDFVTVPAAGGAITRVLEATNRPRPVGEARNIGAWLESRLHLELTHLGDEMYGQGRLTREERIVLSSAIGDALQAWTTRVEADAPQLFARDLYDEPTAQATANEEANRRANEATPEEIRRALQAAIRATHGEDDAYLFLRDYDADQGLAWWDRSTEDDCTTWQQAYTRADDGAISLTGAAVQVVARTVYDPIPAGDTPATVQQADNAAAPTIPIQPASATSAAPHVVTEGAPPTAPAQPPQPEEAPIVGTQQNAGPAPGGQAAGTTPATETRPDNNAAATATTEAARIALLEAERDQLRTRTTTLSEQLAAAQDDARKANARAAEAEAKARRLEGNEAGRTTVDRLLNAPESGVPENLRALIGPRVHATVANNVPFTKEGEVDQTALDAAVQAAIRAERVHAASLLESQGVGRVAGLGAEGDPSMQVSTEALEQSLEGIFASIGMDEKAARIAAKGRN